MIPDVIKIELEVELVQMSESPAEPVDHETVIEALRLELDGLPWANGPALYTFNILAIAEGI